jgi:hypothetical protein
MGTILVLIHSEANPGVHFEAGAEASAGADTPGRGEQRDRGAGESLC